MIYGSTRIHMGVCVCVHASRVAVGARVGLATHSQSARHGDFDVPDIPGYAPGACMCVFLSDRCILSGGSEYNFTLHIRSS